MSDLQLHTFTSTDSLPAWAPLPAVAEFFHSRMQPYQDTPEDIARGLDYAFSIDPGRGGFLLLAEQVGQLAGALLMLNTGMQGYIPEHLLLFVCVDPALRGHGLGTRLIHAAAAQCSGDIKLHVDHANPARQLYQRLGFTEPYVEMRWRR
jgi:[ribosomal protein S18]-alanine N-acetyltransferase